MARSADRLVEYFVPAKQRLVKSLYRVFIEEDLVHVRNLAEIEGSAADVETTNCQ